MEWVNRLIAKTVGLDTAPLIYFIVEKPSDNQYVKTFFESLDRGEIDVVTSPVTLEAS